MNELTVRIPEKQINYTIKIKKGLLKTIGTEISKLYHGQKIAVVTDENVAAYYGGQVTHLLESSGFEVKWIVLPAGEATKTFDSLQEIYKKLLNAKLTRSDLLIAFGGGVIGDIAGFAAATFLRGIHYIQIPTTLLAQVDSSVGGKVAVDLPQGKNLVGAFYHPQLVLIDPSVLETLTDAFFTDGMAEVVKYAFIKKQDFFDQLSVLKTRSAVMEEIESIISTCCKIKQGIVEKDEKDTGERMLLNFGHTIGHALETFYAYKKYSHGQAVAIGMYQITKLSEERGLTETGTAAKLKDLLEQFHLPVENDTPEENKSILEYIGLDKKNLNGQLNVVLLRQIGKACLKAADLTFFEALQEMEIES